MSDHLNNPTLGYQSKVAARPPQPSCVKCGTRMIQGIERVDAGGHNGVAAWMQGEVRRGWLGILRFPTGRRYEIITFRCHGCGFLERYTPPG